MPITYSKAARLRVQRQSSSQNPSSEDESEPEAPEAQPSPPKKPPARRRESTNVLTSAIPSRRRSSETKGSITDASVGSAKKLKEKAAAAPSASHTSSTTRGKSIKAVSSPQLLETTPPNNKKRRVDSLPISLTPSSLETTTRPTKRAKISPPKSREKQSGDELPDIPRDDMNENLGTIPIVLDPPNAVTKRSRGDGHGRQHVSPIVPSKPSMPSLNVTRSSRQTKPTPSAPKVTRRGSAKSAIPSSPQLQSSSRTSPQPQIPDELPTPPLRNTPKDLSSIFAAHTPSGLDTPPARNLSANSTPRRSRMLGKASTLPNIPKSPSQTDLPPGSQNSIASSSRSVQQTTSLPALPASPNKLEDESVTDPEPIPSRPPMRTYGSVRSFLAPIPPPGGEDGDGPDADELESQELFQHESYADLRKKYRIDMSSDDDMDTGITGIVDLKTIGEMRDKGENRRFMDDMGYLLEGLSPQMSLSVRRLSAIKLVNNMGDVEYVRRARACDALGTAWSALQDASEGDKIMGVAQAAFCVLATQDPKASDELARDSTVGKTLCRLISTRPADDVLCFTPGQERALDARRLGIGKPERALISQIRQVLKSARGLEDESIITTRHLCSDSLLTLRRYDRDIILTTTEEIIRESKLISPRIQAYRNGLAIIPDPPSYDTPNVQHIDNCLRILEASILSSSATHPHETLLEKQGTLVQSLLTTSTACAIADSSAPGANVQASTCLLSALRLLVKLADADSSWPEFISRVPSSLSLLVRLASLYHGDFGASVQSQNILADDDSHDQSATRLDVFCLVLALLTGVLVDDATSRAKLFSLTLSSNCKFGHSCTADCTCLDECTSVSALANMYIAESRKSYDGSNPEAAFLKGHLAILLGLLCDGANPSDISTVIGLLPNAADDERSTKLEALIETIREFTVLYTDLARGFAKAIQTRNRRNEVNSSAGDDDEVPDDDEIGLPQSTDSVAHLPTTFGEDEGHAGEKGIELAERVIRVLADIAEQSEF